MADLYILLPSHEDSRPVYAWRSGSDWQTADTPPAGRTARGESVVAFVPGTAVTSHRVEVMGRKPAEVRRTALFALEDDVAQPVEALHVALSAPDEDGRRKTQVVAAADMRSWIATLTGAGYAEASLVATHDVLPSSDMAVEGPDEILISAAGQAMALDAEAPADLVRTLAPETISTVHGERLAASLGVEPAGPALKTHSDWLIQLAEWYEAQSSGQVVPLRQGEFSIRQPLQLDGLGQWRPVAAMAAAGLVLWFGTVVMETHALQSQAAELRSRTSQLMTSVAPEAQGNLDRAMASLRQVSGGDLTGVRPTTAMAALYEGIAPTANAEVRSLRYDGGNGRLTAMVVFDSYSEADAIASRLEEKGLAVSLGEARQSGNRVLGEFVIEAVS